MFCDKCGKEVKSNFCSNCGSKVSAVNNVEIEKKNINYKILRGVLVSLIIIMIVVPVSVFGLVVLLSFGDTGHGLGGAVGFVVVPTLILGVFGISLIILLVAVITLVKLNKLLKLQKQSKKKLFFSFPAWIIYIYCIIICFLIVMEITRESRYEKWHEGVREEVFLKMNEDNSTEDGY